MLPIVLQTNLPKIKIKGVDVTNIVKGLTLTESIFEPAIKGSIITVDTASSRLYQVTGAIGDLNPVEISFFSRTGSGQEDSIEPKDLLIYKIEPGTEFGMTNSSNVCYFATKPFFVNQSRLISKYYDDTISNVVKELCKELEIECEVESTSDKIKMILSYDSPFAHIIALSKKAKSDKHPKDLDFVFFEGIDNKYYFKPISSFKDKEVKWKYKVLKPHPELTVQDAKFSILKHGATPFSPIDNALNGMYSSEIITFDTTTGDYTSKTHVFSDNKYTKLSDKKITNNEEVFDKISKSGVAVRRFVKQRFLFDCGEDPSGYDKVGLQDDWVGDRMVSMQTINQIVLNINVPGNSNMRVGDIIEVRKPINEAIIENEGQEPKEKDIFYSGKFLVTDITHDILLKPASTPDAITAVYTMRVRAIKDSKGEEYA